MKERPILFNGEMVKAILDGRKTQTRRALKYQPFEMKPYKIGNHKEQLFDCRGVIIADSLDQYLNTLYLCPFGKVGDRLWVRETWTYDKAPDGRELVVYRAGCPNNRFNYVHDDGLIEELEVHKWRPSIHMPRWASRINLEITNVRVERLQDISELDAQSEGTYCYDPTAFFTKSEMENSDQGYLDFEYRSGFFEKWCDIYGTKSYSENPWVWCISFRMVK